jgi:hypothetical protein
MNDGIMGTPVNLFFGKLLHFFTVLDLVDKDLCRLKAGDIVLIDNQGRITGNIPCYLLFPFFVNKAAETTDINVTAI